MKIKITKPTGETLEAEGTATELGWLLASFVPQPFPVAPCPSGPLWPWDRITYETDMGTTTLPRKSNK
jgi:hypothetical protein